MNIKWGVLILAVIFFMFSSWNIYHFSRLNLPPVSAFLVPKLLFTDHLQVGPFRYIVARGTVHSENIGDCQFLEQLGSAMIVEWEGQQFTVLVRRVNFMLDLIQSDQKNVCLD